MEGKGLVLGKLKEYGDALECYDNSLKLEPDYVDAWNNKGATYMVLLKIRKHWNVIIRR